MMASKPSTSGTQLLKSNQAELPVVVKQEPVVKEEPQSDDDDEAAGLRFEVVTKAEPIWEAGSSGSQSIQENQDSTSINRPRANSSEPCSSEPFIFAYKDWNYKCDRCSLTFPSETALTDHVAEHRAIDLRIYQCKPCKKCFGTLAALKAHGLCDGRTFQCSKCYKQFQNRSRFTKHVVMHRNELFVQFLDGETLDTEGMYRCTECGATYDTLIAIRQHFHSHPHLYKDLTFRCSWCGKQCLGEEHLRLHENTHGLLRCDECQKTYPSQSTLMRHKRTHQTNKYMKLIDPHVLRTEGLFKCLVCRKYFERYEAALFHVRNHINALEGRYQCLVCHLKCNSAFVLRSHMNSHHQPDKVQESGAKSRKITPFCCPLCGRYSKNALCLKMHLKRHEDIRLATYKCQWCSKNCGTNVELTRHYESFHNSTKRVEISSEDKEEEEDEVKESEMEQQSLGSPISVEDSSEEEGEDQPTIKAEPLEESDPAAEMEQQQQQQHSLFESVVVKEEPKLCEEKSTKFIIESCVKGEPGEEDDGDEDEEVYYVVVIREEDEAE